MWSDYFWEFDFVEFGNGSAAPHTPPIVEYCRYGEKMYCKVIVEHAAIQT